MSTTLRQPAFEVSIPRQSRGLYDVSRSKRHEGGADATPMNWATYRWRVSGED